MSSTRKTSNVQFFKRGLCYLWKEDYD